MNKPLSFYDRIRVYSESRSTLFVAFIWGAIEAIFFFLVPDIFLGLVALFNWRKGLPSIIFTLIGAMVGGAIMYTLASNNTLAMDRFLISIPLINESTVNSVKEQMGLMGLRALVTGPLEGIPYKIYAAQAGALGFPLLPFLLITIPARLERILPVALLGSIMGIAFKKFIQRHAELVVGAYIVLWICIYALYYIRFR
jgi:membrane protein YqaA with SNARE-associated domain